MAIIQVDKTVCDFDTEEQQKESYDVMGDLSPCEGCGKDMCKWHIQTIVVESFKPVGRVNFTRATPRLITNICPDCMEGFEVLVREWLRVRDGGNDDNS